MAPKLNILAIELIEKIASELEPVDLFSLRLVCKELNKKTLHAFGRSCLATIQTDLSRKSLQRLGELSEHEQLKHYVRTLLIKGPNDIGREFLWNRHPSGYLVPPLPAVQILRDILLNNLVNCRSFHIYRDHEEEDVYESDCLTPSDVVGIILSIITETSLPVKSFIVDFRKWGTGEVDAKRLQILQYRSPEFRSAWAHLQELSLEQSMTLDTFDWTLDLVLSATSLQKLTLRFEFDLSAEFIDRLSSSEIFPRLREFCLSSAYTTLEVISRLLLRVRNSLRKISFYQVSIVSGGTWGTVFREISHLPLLESINVNFLADYNQGRVMFPAISDNPIVPKSQGRSFNFVYKKHSGRPRIFGVSYRGPGIGLALEILEKSVEYV